MYGVVAYTTAATIGPAPCHRSVRARYSTPAPAAKMMAPSQSRCATQMGLPSWRNSQWNVPIGNTKPMFWCVTAPRWREGSQTSSAWARNRPGSV